MYRTYDNKKITYSVKCKPKTELWRCLGIEDHKPCSCCCPNSCPSIAFIENWRKLDAETETLR
jgi:hypothetical protein